MPREITVVIATYKRPDPLATALESLKKQTLPPSHFQVSAVIDGVDETEAQYRRVLDRARQDLPFALRYEFQKNAGQSVARHRAVMGTDTPWICLIDDDMDPLPGFLAAHLAALQAGGDKTVVIGRVIPEDNWEQSPLYEAVLANYILSWHEAMGRGEKAPTGDMLAANVSFGREFYLAVGGFDEKLRLGEDSELGLRFEFAGGRFVFASEAAAIHRSRVGSYQVWLRRCIEYGRADVDVYKKLGHDRSHPLQDLVTGSRLNAVAVHALSWSDPLAHLGIAALRTIGNVLQRLGLVGPAIATHNAI